MCEIILQAKEGKVVMRELMDAFHRKCDSSGQNLIWQWKGFVYKESGSVRFISTGHLWFKGDDKDIQTVVDSIGGKGHLEEFFAIESDVDDVWSHLEPCLDPWCYVWEKPSLERELNLIYNQHNYGESLYGKQEKALPMSETTKSRVNWLKSEIWKYTIPYTSDGECELASKKPTYYKDAIQRIHEHFGPSHA